MTSLSPKVEASHLGCCARVEAQREFAAAIRRLDREEDASEERELTGSMFKSDADRAADLNAYFNREG